MDVLGVHKTLSNQLSPHFYMLATPACIAHY